MPYHVLIIEDDSMVAAIDRQYVESDRRFQVDRVFKNGLPALDYLAEHRADLVILDYYTPQMNGQEFLDRLLALPASPSPRPTTRTSFRPCSSGGCWTISSSPLSCPGSARPWTAFSSGRAC